MDDPYLVLGVNYSDDFKTIRKKFIELCRKYHPDKVGTNEFLDLMKEINNAYEKIKKEKENNNNEKEKEKEYKNNKNENIYKWQYEENRAEEDEAEAYQKFFARTGGNSFATSLLMGTQIYNKKRERNEVNLSGFQRKAKGPTLSIGF